MTWLLSTILWPTRRSNWWISVPFFFGLVLLVLAILPFSSASRLFGSTPPTISIRIDSSCFRTGGSVALDIAENGDLIVDVGEPRTLKKDVLHRKLGSQSKNHITLDPVGNSELSSLAPPLSRNLSCRSYDVAGLKTSPSSVTWDLESVRYAVDVIATPAYEMVLPQINASRAANNRPAVRENWPFPITVQYVVSERTNSIVNCKGVFGPSNIELAILRNTNEPVVSDRPDGGWYCLQENQALLHPELSSPIWEAYGVLLADAEINPNFKAEGDAKRLLSAVWRQEGIHDFFWLFARAPQGLTYRVKCPECVDNIRGDFRASIDVSYLSIDKASEPIAVTAMSEVGFGHPDLQIVDGNIGLFAPRDDAIWSQDTLMFLAALLGGVGITLLIEVAILLLHRVSQPSHWKERGKSKIDQTETENEVVRANLLRHKHRTRLSMRSLWMKNR